MVLEDARYFSWWARVIIYFIFLLAGSIGFYSIHELYVVEVLGADHIQFVSCIGITAGIATLVYSLTGSVYLALLGEK